MLGWDPLSVIVRHPRREILPFHACLFSLTFPRSFCCLEFRTVPSPELDSLTLEGAVLSALKHYVALC